MRHPSVLATLALALALLAACAPPGATPASITVTPDPASTTVGGHQQFEAVAVDENGLIVTDLTLTWESSATEIATISQAGLATGQALGTTYITASAGGVTSPPARLDVLAGGSDPLAPPPAWEGSFSGSEVSSDPDANVSWSGLVTWVEVTSGVYPAEYEIYSGSMTVSIEGSSEDCTWSGSIDVTLTQQGDTSLVLYANDEYFGQIWQPVTVTVTYVCDPETSTFEVPLDLGWLKTGGMPTLILGRMVGTWTQPNPSVTTTWSWDFGPVDDPR